MIKRFYIIISLLSCIFVLEAKLNWAAYPAGGFSDETGISIGALSYLRFLPDIPDSTVRYNSLYVLAKYTTKKQFELSLRPELFWDNGNNKFSANIEFERWPTKYYGIGNEMDFDNWEKYTPETYYIDLEISRRVFANLSISALSDIKTFEVVKNVEPSELAIYNDFTLVSGLGIGLTWDSRNGQYYPTKGIFGKYTLQVFDELWGTDYEFSQQLLDLRQYLAVTRQSVLSWQFITGISGGEVPYYKLFRLDKDMRGIPANLHRDKNFSVLRSEYKIFPWHGYYTGKIGFAGFLEFGSVFDQIEKYQLIQNKINYGAGFRYTILPGDKLNFRVDAGFGENGMQLTIMGTEEF